jgi:hypothetical protein
MTTEIYYVTFDAWHAPKITRRYPQSLAGKFVIKLRVKFPDAPKIDMIDVELTNMPSVVVEPEEMTEVDA